LAQQSRLFVHRARQAYVQQHTGLISRIRGLLSGLSLD
jgi:transposase